MTVFSPQNWGARGAKPYPESATPLFLLYLSCITRCDRAVLQDASNYCCLTQWVEQASCLFPALEPASCRLSIFHPRQDAHPTPIHAAPHIKAFANPINPKRSLLADATGVASSFQVSPQFRVRLYLLGLMPAKHARAR
ncbi:MAG: hypothetical protein F6J98_35480 [Moorea sp. SIO4G2]|nr:hypothetical protein [Moorena sp. SIO4G2]